ncbi:GNAT family N-acetyltransferase [Taibaiella lutea]|nr:GNAT family N-acetyltransferase [Taibaiella lutea]
MKIIATENINPLQKECIYKLWNEAYPSTIVYNSIDQLDDYLNSLAEVTHYFFMDTDDVIAGWAVTFIRNNEKWFAIIVNKDFQGKGAGSRILSHLKEHNAALSGWVIDEGGYLKSDGSAYRAPLHFYLKNGFQLVENVILDIPQMKAVKICWHG